MYSLVLSYSEVNADHQSRDELKRPLSRLWEKGGQLNSCRYSLNEKETVEVEYVNILHLVLCRDRPVTPLRQVWVLYG